MIAVLHSALRTDLAKNLTLCVGLSVAFAACNPPERSDATAFSRQDSLGILIVQNAAYPQAPHSDWSISQSPTIAIDDTGSNAAPLATIRGPRLFSDGSFVFGEAKSRELRFFDARGVHLRTVGRTGQGPGEFAYLDAVFNCAGDTVITWDVSQRRISKWSRGGAFLTSALVARRPPGAGGAIKGVSGSCRDLLWDAQPPLSKHPARWRLPRTLVWQAMQDTVFRTILSYEGLEAEEIISDGMTQTGPVPFAADPVFAVIGNSVALGLGGKPEYRVYADDGKLLRIVRWPQVAVPVVDSVRALLTNNRELHKKLNPDDAKYITSIDAHSRMNMLPYYDAMVTGGDGRVWLRNYRLYDVAIRADLDKSAERWAVFDSSGKFEATAVMQPGFQLTAAANDLVIGTFTDLLGQLSVRVYDIVKRPPNSR